jgi:hypothetical protein
MNLLVILLLLLLLGVGFIICSSKLKRFVNNKQKEIQEMRMNKRKERTAKSTPNGQIYVASEDKIGNTTLLLMGFIFLFAMVLFGVHNYFVFMLNKKVKNPS